MIREIAIIVILCSSLIGCADSNPIEFNTDDNVASTDTFRLPYNPITGESNNFKKETFFRKVESYQDSIQIIRRTSFGECRGYCKSQYLLNRKGVAITSTGWSEDLKPKFRTEVVQDSDINDLIDRIISSNLETGQFSYGCPDCRDQGAEYFNITIGEINFEVSCEFRQNIPQLDSLINDIRALTEGKRTHNNE